MCTLRWYNLATSGCKLLLYTSRYFSKTSSSAMQPLSIPRLFLLSCPQRMTFSVCCIFPLSSSSYLITSDNVPWPCIRSQLNSPLNLFIYNFRFMLRQGSLGIKLSISDPAPQIFTVQLSLQEMRSLTELLPKGFAFHPDYRKKEKVHPKKKTPEELLISMNSDVPQKPKSIPKGQPQPQPKKGAQKDLISQAVKPCLKTLDQLKQHKCSWPFLEPVDVEALNIPEYNQIVKEPMDLSTLEGNLKSGQYKSPAQFHSDVIKIFHNSYLFNSTYEDFIKITHQFQRYYYRISGESKPVQQKQVIPKPPAPSKQQKKKKKPPTGARQNADTQPVTTEQKRELASLIHRLAKEHIKGVRNIVFDGNSDQNEFDLEKLSQKKLRQLQKYIRNKIAEMEHNMRTSMMQKSEQQNLDDLESDITEEFIDEPLDGLMQEE